MHVQCVCVCVCVCVYQVLQLLTSLLFMDKYAWHQGPKLGVLTILRLPVVVRERSKMLQSESLGSCFASGVEVEPGNHGRLMELWCRHSLGYRINGILWLEITFLLLSLFVLFGTPTFLLLSLSVQFCTPTFPLPHTSSTCTSPCKFHATHARAHTHTHTHIIFYHLL